MTMQTEARTVAAGEDAQAIAELEEILERQREAFVRDPMPSLEERQELLGALAGMMLSHREQIQEALSIDFGVHPVARLRPDRSPRHRRTGRVRRRTAAGVDGGRAASHRPCAVRLRPRVRPAAAQGRGREHRPLELPLRPLRGAARGDAGGGQPRRDQAFGAHARVRRAAARDGSRDLRARSRGCGRRWARARPRVHPRALGSPAVHGQPGDRARDRKGRGRAARAR